MAGLGNNGIIVKDRFDHGGSGYVVSQPGNYQIKDPSGKVLESRNVGSITGEHGNKLFSSNINRGNTFVYTPNGGGKAQTFTYGGGRQAFSIDTDGIPGSSSGGSVSTDGSGATTDAGGGSQLGVAEPINPGSVGQFPTIPKQPPVQFGTLNPQQVPFRENPFAIYNQVDVANFVKQFGQQNSAAVGQNFQQGQDMAIAALGTELKGLQGFAPAAGALSREQTGIDNTTNQGTRTAQVNAVLPNANNRFDTAGNALDAQGNRAATYAKGELTSDTLDRAMELGIRSKAADSAGFSGIGTNSEQASKVSDLMSADQRFQIAQYGESLTGQNVQNQSSLIGNQAALDLAPTEYSNIGSQIKPTPEVGAGRLAYQGAGMLNEATLVTPGQALSTDVNQAQFDQSARARNNEFNTTNQINNDQYDANMKYNAQAFNIQGKFNADTFNSNMDERVNEFNSQGIWQGQQIDFAAKQQFLTAAQTANQGMLNNQFAAATGVINAGVTAGTQGQVAAGVQTAAVGQSIGVTAAGIGGIGAISAAQVPAPVTTTSSAATPGSSGSVSSGTSGGTVSGSNIDTSPSNSGSNGSGNSGNSNGNTPGQYDLTSGNNPAPTSINATPDISSPGAYRFAPGATVPQGYAPVSKSADGSVLTARTSDYGADIERFSKFSGNPANSSAVVPIVNADKAISKAADISYIPSKSFTPMALTSSGKQVYSDSVAAQSSNVAIGAQQVGGSVATALNLGVTDTAQLEPMLKVAQIASSPVAHADLDSAYNSGGPEAVAKNLVDYLGVDKKNADNPLAQQVTAGALRIGELWPKLSPAQRSLAISTLAVPAVSAATGKNLADNVVPGTEKAVGKPLTVGDVSDVTMKGRNGFALARNYRQLSALSSIVRDGAPIDPLTTAGIAEYGGFMGHGAQGSAVPLPSKYLQKVGAMPAPQLGVGAALFNSPNHVPQNYKTTGLTPDGRVVALPENLLHTSVIGDDKPNNAAAFKAATQVATHTHPAQKLWSGKRVAAVRGAAGGSAIISGMNLTPQANGDLAGAITGYSLFNNTHGAA